MGSRAQKHNHNIWLMYYVDSIQHYQQFCNQLKVFMLNFFYLLACLFPKLPSSSFLTFPQLLHNDSFVSCVTPTTCMSSLGESINLLLGLPLLLLPGGFMLNILLPIWLSSLLCTCANHINLATLTFASKTAYLPHPFNKLVKLQLICVINLSELTTLPNCYDKLQEKYKKSDSLMATKLLIYFKWFNDSKPLMYWKFNATKNLCKHSIIRNWE